MSTTTILDKILRKLKKFRESISQLFYYSSRKRNRFALAGKGCRTWRSSNANPTCNGKQLISVQILQYESLVPKELWFLSVGEYQYLSRCVLWGAHSLTGICLLLSPARPAPDVAHFHLGQNPKAHRRESHFPQPPRSNRATWVRARCSEGWGRWSHVRNHGLGAHTQGAFLQRADDKGACSDNWKVTTN